MKENFSIIKLKVKLRHIYLALFLISNTAFSQSNFDLGVDFFNKGDYKRADSCLIIYVKQFPGDNNGLYNLSVTKLLLGDTCSFCNGLLNINYPYDIDKEAVELYFSLCGYTDTIFYNKNNKVVTNLKYNYYEVIEHHHYQDLIIGKYHNRKPKYPVTRMNLNAFDSFKTDIFGVYKIIDDSIKVFTIAESLPVFSEKQSSLNDFLKKSSTFDNARKEFNLSGYRVNIKYVVKKNGRVDHIEIVSTKPDFEKQEELLIYLKQMLNTIPNYTPAEFKGEYINFSITERLNF